MAPPGSWRSHARSVVMVSPTQTVSIQSGCTAVLIDFEIVLRQLGRGHDQDDAGVEHEVGDLGQAPHVLLPVLLLALDVGVHAVEHVADAEEVDHLAVLEELALERLRQALPVGLVLAGDRG